MRTVTGIRLGFCMVLAATLAVWVGLSAGTHQGPQGIAAAHGVDHGDDHSLHKPLHGWWDPERSDGKIVEYTSDHYRLITDLPEARAEEILREIEAHFELYATVIGKERIEEAQAGDRFVVRIFRTLADFQTYHKERWNEDGSRIGFVYHFTRAAQYREAVGFLKPRDPFFDSLRHEGFHQVLRSVVAYPPQWLNEGLAEYLEAARRIQDEDGTIRFEPAIHAGWARQLREFIGTEPRHRYAPIAMDDLIQMTKQDWMARNGTTYPSSWAATWLLLHELEEGSAAIGRYLDALTNDATREENNAAAWEATFGGPDTELLSALQARFDRFSQEVRPTPAYDRFQEAVLLTRSDDYDDALEAINEVIEQDENFYAAYYYRGYLLRQLNQRSRALDDMRRAIAIFPEYASAIRMAIPLAIQEGYLEEAQDLAQFLSRLSSRYSEEAAAHLNRIEQAMEDRAESPDAADALPELPDYDGWAPLEAESDSE